MYTTKLILDYYYSSRHYNNTSQVINYYNKNFYLNSLGELVFMNRTRFNFRKLHEVSKWSNIIIYGINGRDYDGLIKIPAYRYRPALMTSGELPENYCYSLSRHKLKNIYTCPI